MSVFWYPQLARPLPRSGRVPRRLYNTCSDEPAPPSARVSSVTMEPLAASPGFFKTAGAPIMLSMFFFLVASALLLVSYELGTLWYRPEDIFPFALLACFAAGCFSVPFLLFWRHRTLRRLIDAAGEPQPRTSSDRFIY